MVDMTNEQALDAFADALEPLTEILGDAEIIRAYNADLPYIKLVQMAIKRHKKEVVEVLAISDGVPVDEYKVNFLTLPVKALALLNALMTSDDMKDFFSSRNQDKEN